MQLSSLIAVTIVLAMAISTDFNGLLQLKINLNEVQFIIDSRQN